MRYIILTLTLLFSLSSLSQNWKYEDGGSAFDGKYKTAYIQGTGNKFPYKTPSLIINKFEGKPINFYISGAGFFQENTGVGVLWVFDNEPNTIYTTPYTSISSDGKTLFFSEFNNPNGSGRLKSIDMIEKLTLANKVTVRAEDKFGSNDIVFSLSGSTKAINFVIPKEERQQMIDKGLEERNTLAEAEAKNQTILNDLMQRANEEKISSSSLSSLKSQFEKDLGLSYYSGMGTGKTYKSISLKADLEDSMFESYGYVDIFYILEDGSKEKIFGTWKVEMDAPIFARLKEEKAKAEVELANKKAKDKDYLKGLLSKYQREDIINHLIEKVVEESESYSEKFNIQEIESVKITLSDYLSYKKTYSDCKVDILLKNGKARVIRNTYLSLENVLISKKDLKALGGKEMVAF